MLFISFIFMPDFPQGGLREQHP